MKTNASAADDLDVSCFYFSSNYFLNYLVRNLSNMMALFSSLDEKCSSFFTL